MKNSRMMIAFLALGLSAGCAHKPKGPLDREFDAALQPVSELFMCMPRALSARMAGTPKPFDGADPAADEKRRRMYFKEYYVHYLEAQEQAKYLACLKKRKPANYREKYREAKGWLKGSQDEVDKYAPVFPKEQRIVDVKEEFINAAGKPAVRRVTITLRDGSRKVVEEILDRGPSAKPQSP